MLRRFGRGNVPDVGSAGYRHPAPWSIGRSMPLTFLIREEPYLPVTGEPNSEAPQQSARNCDSSIGDTSYQPVRWPIQLLRGVQGRAPALWAVWAWRFLDIHFTLEKTRLLSGFCSVNKLNRSRRALFPMCLLRSLFTMSRPSSTRITIRRIQVH